MRLVVIALAALGLNWAVLAQTPAPPAPPDEPNPPTADESRPAPDEESAPTTEPPPPLARELSLGTMKVVKGETLRVAAEQETFGDVYAWVSEAKVDGVIGGDLLVWAYNVDVPGSIRRDLDAFAFAVAVGGDVGSRLRSLAYRTVISGEVGADAVIFGAEAVLEPAGTVRGSLAIYAGSAEVSGVVDGPAWIAAGKVEINGHIAGDVTVSCDELHLGPAAKIDGALTYNARQMADVREGAVAGPVTRKREEALETQTPLGGRPFWKSPWFGAGLSLYFALVSLIGGSLLLLFFRPTVDGALERAVSLQQFAVAFGIGLVTLLAMLVLGVLCCFLLPLALAVWCALGALFYFGGLIGKMVLGQWALRLLLRRRLNPFLALLVGVVVVFLVGLVPILGTAFAVLVKVVGMGAAMLQLREARVAQLPASSSPAGGPTA